MNIALATPNFWPYVRRGTARYVSTLSNYLIKRGHRITIIAAKPGKSKEVEENGIVIKYYPYIQHPLFLKHVNRFHTFTAASLWSFCKDDYDVIYCMHFPEGFAAHLAGKIKRIQYLLNITSVPFSKYWEKSSLNEFLFKKGVFSASGLLLPSRYSAQCMQEDYGITGKVIPMPVDTSYFSHRCKKDFKKPIILFTSDLSDRRKGLLLLLEAFYLFKKKVSGAVLLLAGQADIHTIRKLSVSIDHDMKDSIYVLGQERLANLPALYSLATMTVLPSMYEVFGMVLLESLASGTPVVGCENGAVPEIINSPEIGRLFDPKPEGDEATNAAGLCAAMVEVFEIAQKANTSQKCREHAKSYDISIVGEKIESFLFSIAPNNSS